MKCHYEVLGLSRDAADDEIKKSYRKLALKWHPDKNINNIEIAREQFQLIQQAYEVLIDSHERCFYDNHREQILRGKNSNYEDNSLDVFQYFTVTCFKGYSDDPNGFYHIYAAIFEKITSEDAEFMDDEEDIVNIPKFGNSQSDYDDIVGPFYAYWQSYCTKKTYTWLCKYDITEIKDRRILREIEKETKKIAQKAKRERNEEIRNLVSFVRKRDKRVQAYRKQLEEKAEQNRKKQEQNRIEQIRKRQREVEEMRNSHDANALKPDDYEDQLRLLEQEYGEGSDDDSDDDSDDESYTDVVNNSDNNYGDDELQYYDNLYCIACNKAFKNENAFINHEISQKHLTNVDKLKTKMALEENEYLVGNDDINNDRDSKLESNDEEEIVRDDELSIHDEEKSAPETDEENFGSKRESKKTKKKKSKKSQPAKVVESDIDDKEQDEIPDLLANLNVEKNDNWEDDSKKSGKKSKNKKSNKQEIKKIVKNEEIIVAATSTNNVNDIKLEPSKPKKVVTAIFKENDGIDVAHVCVTCKSTFDSKNKLFSHLKKTNHGVYIPKEMIGTNSIANGHSAKKGKKK